VMSDEDVVKARYLARHLTVEHPKLQKVSSVVGGQLRTHPDSRIIVFTHYRDTSDLVAKALERVEGARPVRFVGQASHGDDKGLSQKEQADLIERFKKGVFNILVATSVGEEGLDIPSTELVVFYEPVPSEIRTIQRRGRTGRKMPGKVVILRALGTRDEAFYWASRRKEQRMMEELDILRRQLADKISVGFPAASGNRDAQAPEKSEASSVEIREYDEHDACPAGANGAAEPRAPAPAPGIGGPEMTMRPDAQTEPGRMPAAARRGSQLRLEDIAAGKPAPITIITDHREFNSEVVRELSRYDLRVRPEQLEVGDYILSDRVGAERKQVKDFVASLIDGRIFPQLRSLKSAYSRPLLIIEGENLLLTGGISREALLGTMASILIDYGVPIVSTKDEHETAALLMAIARREHDAGRIPAIRGEKGSMSISERLQFIVEGLPHVSGTLSQRLLSHFGSVERIVQASAEELAKVKGIGKGTAQEIFSTLRAGYLASRGGATGGLPGPGGAEKGKITDSLEEE
jgi:ERCC4-type nuclease